LIAWAAEFEACPKPSAALNIPLVIIFGLSSMFALKEVGSAACTLELGKIIETKTGKSSKPKTISSPPIKKRILYKRESENSTITLNSTFQYEDYKLYTILAYSAMHKHE
jgi:hypothetical protein